MLEQKIAKLVESSLNAKGFDLVQVKIHNTARPIVEILIDKLDDTRVSVIDCKVLSKSISTILEVEDLIDGKYNLEVSSAGVERPLIKLADFVKFNGKEIKLKVKVAIENCKVFQGKITQVSGDEISLNCKEKEVTVKFDEIKSARLVFTDEIFRALLKKEIKEE